MHADVAALMYAARILALVPHSDDEIVGAAAAIERARAQGSKVFAAYLTDGVPARELLWPWARGNRETRAQARWAEALAVAATLGVQPVLQQTLATRMLRDDLGPTRARLIAALAEHQIDMLWVPAYEGGHQDHDAANCLASTLREAVAVWEFAEYHHHEGRIGLNRFISPAANELTLSLTKVEQQRKRELLAMYPSERGNLSYVGTQAEQFRPLASYDYCVPAHAGKTFYQRFQWVPWHPRIDRTQPHEVCLSLVSFLAEVRSLKK